MGFKSAAYHLLMIEQDGIRGHYVMLQCCQHPTDRGKSYQIIPSCGSPPFNSLLYEQLEISVLFSQATPGLLISAIRASKHSIRISALDRCQGPIGQA
jgi:hypothetical protein